MPGIIVELNRAEIYCLNIWILTNIIVLIFFKSQIYTLGCFFFRIPFFYYLDLAACFLTLQSEYYFLIFQSCKVTIFNLLKFKIIKSHQWLAQISYWIYEKWLSWVPSLNKNELIIDKFLFSNIWAEFWALGCIFKKSGNNVS